MGESFGIAGGCSCDGDIATGLGIRCAFEDECVDEIGICGSLALNFTLGETAGAVSVSVCVEFEDDEYMETCFSYGIDLANSDSQTCTASYGGKDCDCEIDNNFCLSLNCEAYLPGATIDTCQQLQMVGFDDATTFVPRFEIFDPNFAGFNFENINLENIDWENLDVTNFDLDMIDWQNTDWNNTQWSDLFSVNVNEDVVCPTLQRAIDMSEGFAGNCDCGEGGFDIDCSFEEVCTDASLCGSVNLNFGFDNVGAVDGKACVDFSNDEHLQTCFSYVIPFADSTSLPTCEATYGGDQCSCEIDENFCVKIDCSEFEPTAVTDSCQIISLEDSDDGQMMVPQFSSSGGDAANQGTTSDGHLARLSVAALALVSLPVLLM
jgi:hypothetical protein